uniref:Integrase zinc-binding domain-containing protein n=1 Tax=Trichobilharzia regenti TaxID=157069 RepID=A0AA85K1Z0_TRIRE|nr:unnamed protein product [Trichobilharzia regenti]
MFADRVVVPANLRDHVLRQLHISHPGVGRMKAIARSYVYWPNIDDHIEDLVRKCSKCAQASKCPRKTELCSWPRPDKPWSRVHVDFAGPFNSMHFLICVDAFSKWPEIFPMHSATSIATVSLLRQLLLNVSSTPLSVLMQKRRGREQQKKIWINSCCIIVRMKKDSYVADTQITLYPVPRKGQLDKEELRNLCK